MIAAPLFKIALVHDVPYATVRHYADCIAYKGRIDLKEIDSLSDSLLKLIQDVHAAVMVEQVRLGIIKDGQDSIVLSPTVRLFQ